MGATGQGCGSGPDLAPRGHLGFSVPQEANHPVTSNTKRSLLRACTLSWRQKEEEMEASLLQEGVSSWSGQAEFGGHW